MKQRNLPTIRVSLLFALFSGLTIALVNLLLERFFFDIPVLALRTIKEWILVLAGAAVVSLIVYRELRVRTEAEMNLRKNEERFRALFMNSSDITTILDDEGRIRYSSPSTERLLGYAPPEIAGKSFFDLVHPGDVPRARTAFAASLGSNTAPLPSEYRLALSDGSWISVEARISNLLDHPEIRGIVVTSHDIDERKRLESVLQEQVRFQQHLMDSMPLPIFYKDLEGKYRGCNKSFESYVGRPKEAIIGRSVFDLAPREIAETYEKKDSELFQNPGVQIYDYTVRHAAGAMRDVVFYKSTFTDVSGKVAGLIGAMLDVTARNKVEKSLRETNEMLQALVEASPLAIVTFDREGTVMLWNPAAERIFGWNAKEVLGGFNPIVSKEKEQEFLSLVERVIAGERLVNLSLKRNRKDGVVIDVSVSSAPIHNAAQEPMGIISVIADITEQKKSDADREKLIADIRTALSAVGRAKKEWQDTFDSITDLISIHDRDFNIVRVNKAFAEYVGLPYEQVIGRKCYELLHGGAAHVPGCPHERTMADGQPAAEERLDAASGKRLRVSTYPYSAPDGGLIGSIHVARDITDEKERELRMIMTERLASLGLMASGIAHEINNPLESVMICAEMLLMRVAKDAYDHAQFEKYLKIIDEEVLRCRNITGNMLSFARQTTLSTSALDVHHLLDKSIELVGFQGKLKNVTVNKKYGGQFLVSGNEGELRQVFLVLLINALDAMEGRGSISIETGAEAGRAWIRISDTGPGIAPENLQKIFHPFFSTKINKGGTGLGLSIAHRIIANHRGSLDVASEPGRGAAFTITLPR